MTRIISGKARGRRLAVPASGTRPTADRIRESLFASVDSRLLSTGRGWADISTCDLWAGSGAVALEAWSRGSGRVLAVDKARHAVEALRAVKERHTRNNRNAVPLIHTPVEYLVTDGIKFLHRKLVVAAFCLLE